MPRRYDLGRRRAAVDRTTLAVLAAARELLAAGSPASMTAVARRAGVARVTVYNRFPSRSHLLAGLAPRPHAQEMPAAGPMETLHDAFVRSSAAWATDPALYRRLDLDGGDEAARHLAERLAAADALRPGCSVREAEDVIAALASFPIFDRLHRDGRRTPAALAGILTRLAAGILA